MGGELRPYPGRGQCGPVVGAGPAAATDPAFRDELGERGGLRNHRQAVIVAARAAGLPPSARDADPALRAVYPEAGPAAATDPAFRDDVRGNGSGTYPLRLQFRDGAEEKSMSVA